MDKKEKKSVLILTLGTIAFLIIFFVPITVIDLNGKNFPFYLIGFILYSFLAFWLQSRIKNKTNRIIKVLIYAISSPAIIAYLLIGYIQPFTCLMLSLIVYLMFCLSPIFLIDILNETNVISISHEKVMFLTFTIATIISITFNKQILNLIIKHSPFLRKNYKIEVKELIELTQYVFKPNNIRFVIYFLYFIFLIYYSITYIDNSGTLETTKMDNAILQAFLVFLAYDSIRINSKDIKLLPSYILKKIMNVYLFEMKDNNKIEKEDNNKASL